MGCSRIAAIVGCIVWALITLMGLDLASGVVAQRVPGYPSAEQLESYVYFPALMTCAALALVLLMSFRRVPTAIRTIAASATVLVWLTIPVLMFFYTGGM